MSLNFLDQAKNGLALCRILLLLDIIPHHVPLRHVLRNRLLMVFNGGGAALMWQIVSTGLRSVIGLVCQVPIDVDIGDCREPLLGECRGLNVPPFVKE